MFVAVMFMLFMFWNWSVLQGVLRDEGVSAMIPCLDDLMMPVSIDFGSNRNFGFRLTVGSIPSDDMSAK